MTRKCPKCGYENQDDYDFCAQCGTSLTSINKTVLAVIYIISILMSWGGLLFLNNSYFTFCGVFFPFFLIQSRDSNIRKHGYLLLIISIMGIVLTFYFSFLHQH